MNLQDIFKFQLPLDVMSAIAGGVVGFIIVFIVDWIKNQKLGTWVLFKHHPVLGIYINSSLK